jgi:pyridoxine 5-phosphate synthase
MTSKRYIRLGVNIDHCATVRQARYRGYPRLRGEVVEPDPLAFALAAERAGADGITLHPREDERHIQRGDVTAIRDCIQIPLNLEMAATDAMVEFAHKVRPNTVCLVPEKREELTTEGGLDVLGQKERLRGVVAAMTEAGIDSSLFIDPDPAQIDAAVDIGAPIIELHTGTYANSYYTKAKRTTELTALREGAAQAHAAGLVVNLGHGINYTNVLELRDVPWIHEMNIGHTLVARALFSGIEVAVRDLKALMNPS